MCEGCSEWLPLSLSLDLRSEIQQLRALMGTHVDPSSSLLEIRELREKLRASEKLLEESSR